MWRVAQMFTNEVVDRYVHQPMSWHNRRPDGDLVARAGVDAESTVSVLGPDPVRAGNGRHGDRLDDLDACPSTWRSASLP